MNLHVVVVTYNPGKWLDRCFGSLRASLLPVQTVVIDNGSTDGSQEKIKQEYPEVNFIQSGQNLGFGKANNIGIRKAYDAGADYVMLLNQDAWIFPDTMDKLVASASANPAYGIVSPVHLDGSGCRMESWFFGFSVQYGGSSVYSDLMLGQSLAQIYPCSFIPAAAWLLSRKCIETVGGFDPVFFHYGEDNNYCQRTLYHGLKIGFDPKALVCHDSVKDPSTLKSAAYNANRFRSNFLGKVADVGYNPPKALGFMSKYIIRDFFYYLILLDLKSFAFVFRRAAIVIANYSIAVKSRRRNQQKGLNHL